MLPAGVVLRAAEPADLERLLAVIESSPGAPRWSPWTWRQILESPRNRVQRIVLIAESVNECVGLGVLGLAGDDAEIESLAVSADWRRRGIARRLCADLLSWARERHTKHASLEVRVSNTAARSLYQSLGFREIATRRRYYRDPEEDAIVMKKDL